MNLRKRLTLYSTGIFGIVFLICALVIFFAFYKSAINSTYKELKSDALLTAFYYLEKDELPLSEHWLISKEFENNIKKNKIAIYNEKDHISYGNTLADPSVTPEILQQIRDLKQYSFRTKNSFYQGIFYPDNQGDFVVITTSSTTSFNSQITRLLTILLFVFLGGITSIYFLSKYISNIAYKPLKQIVQQVNSIDYHNIDQRVTFINTKDELATLINSYNELLQRLSQSIITQKNFINYASHEFKTPLTAIAGNLEVFAQKPRSSAQYNQVAKKVLENVYRIQSILDNLLLLSSLKVKAYELKPVRSDEILWNIHQSILQKYQVEIQIELRIENSEDLILKANETLLELAIYNLVENAVKYGLNNPVNLILSKDPQDGLSLQIIDKGKGIPDDEIPLLKQIFFRSQDVSHIPGSGIGLSLTASILELHQIKFDIKSTQNIGTKITIFF